MIDERLHYLVVTGIVVKDNKYLIAKRSEGEAAFPGLWTVPGGKITPEDYVNTPKDTADSWYNVLEEAVVREVREEVGLEVEKIRYLLSLCYMRSDSIPTMIISFYCDYKSGDVSLSEELTEHAWVSVDELGNYQFVPGLREEIELVDELLRSGEMRSWEGTYDSGEDESVRDGNLNLEG